MFYWLRMMEIGKVIPTKAFFEEKINLECGRDLDSYEIVYETYGK